MPTYDYECESCGQTIEIFHSISESPKKKCPSCGKPKLKKLPGAGAGFLFKGSGFYITDYRSDDYKAKAKAEKDGGSGAGKGDSKAAGNGATSDTKAASDASKSSGEGGKKAEGTAKEG